MVHLGRFVHTLFCLGLLAIPAAGSLAAQTASDNLPDPLRQLPQVIDEALVRFHTPGMSVGIIKDDQVVYLAGHGMRNIQQQLPVTADTYFRLASVSKAFTAAGLAILIDSGQLNWENPVVNHLPEFQMADAWVTREFTLLDLLTHRSGLASGAGDSMLWPEPSGFSREEIIHNLRYLSPKTSFRSHYAYSNVMYITAGEVIARTAGMPFDHFIDQHIFAPLNMQCFAGDVPDEVLANHAVSFGYSDTRGQYAIPRNKIDRQGLVSAAAGGLTCNAREMLKWLSMWLNQGSLENGERFLSPASIEKLWSPQTVLPIADIDRAWDNTEFSAYGGGWRMSDVLGHKVISHTGTLSGYQAYVTLIPELKLGVVLLNNGSNYGARGAVMQTIVKAYLGKPQPPAAKNWLDAYEAFQTHREQLYADKPKPQPGSNQVLWPLTSYSGTYTDKWFGDMTLTLESGQLRIRSAKMPMLTGTLEPYEGHQFVIRWDNKNAAQDAMIRFETSLESQVSGFTLVPFVAKPSSYHEYSDMHFVIDEVNSLAGAR